MGLIPIPEGSGSQVYASQAVWTSWEGGMDPLTGVATAALVEGVKFLYQQAAEVLSACGICQPV
jgi:hypothetical protein